MDNCGLEIKKDTFLDLDEHGQRSVLFDYMDYMKKKLDSLEKKEAIVHKEAIAIGGIFGFIGGALAMVGRWLVGQ